MTKTCSKCGNEKPIDDFYKNRRYAGGYTRICRRCHIDQSERSAQKPERRERKRLARRAHYWETKGTPLERTRTNRGYEARKARYGMNKEQIDTMMIIQDGRCAICRKVPIKSYRRALHLDDVGILESMIAYLRKHSDG